MTLASIVCENCGAKYRLPETFKSPKAKCKKCGTMIDVAGQRSAAAQPAAASSPAPEQPASKPASTASARTRRASSRSTGEETDSPRASRSARTSRSGSSSRRSGGRRGRGGEETEKKKGKGMLIGVGVLVIALGAGGYFMFLSGPSEAELAAQQAAEEQAAARQAAAAQAATLVTAIQGALDRTAGGVADPDQASSELAGFQTRLDDISAVNTTAAEEPTALLATFKDRVDQAVSEKAAADQADAAAAAAEAAAAEAAAAAQQGAAATDTGDPSEKWMAYVINDPSEVFDPKAETEPAPWPDYVTEEERAEIESLIADVEVGGRRGMSAKTKLEEHGHKALSAIVNRLREIDYTDSFDTMLAYELNKMLERVTITINAGFQEVELGEDVDLRIAHWNASTVKAWLRFVVEMYPTKEDWDRLMKSIRSRDGR